MSIKGTACFYRFKIRKKNWPSACQTRSLRVRYHRAEKCFVWGALLNFSKGRIITVQQTEGTALLKPRKKCRKITFLNIYLPLKDELLESLL